MGQKASKFTESVGRCGPCDKQSFTSMKIAKKYGKKVHHDGHPDGYPCPVNPAYFHYGNLPRKIIGGRMPRALLNPNVMVRR